MEYKTFDLYLVQTPDAVPEAYKENRGANTAMFKYYHRRYRGNTHYVKDIHDFVGRLLAEYFQRRRKLRKLIIGSHGVGTDTHYGEFWIGATKLDQSTGNDVLSWLWPLRAVFAPHAAVYIMACKTGNVGYLLSNVSRALGGISVHGYTDWLYITDYGPLGAGMDDPTDDGVIDVNGRQ